MDHPNAISVVYLVHSPEARARLADLGLALLRVFAGLGLALGHGLGKLPPSERFLAGVVEMGFPFPLFFAWAAALSEFAGGILLALGLLTRPSAFFILCTMWVATFVRQAGDPFGERELSMLYGMVAVLYLLAGPGRYGLDAVLARGRGGAPARTRTPAGESDVSQRTVGGPPLA